MPPDRPRAGLAAIVLVAVASITIPDPASAQEPSAAKTKGQSAWDAVYIAGSKVGYIHTRVEPLTEAGRDLRRVRYDASLSFNRGKDPVTILQQYGTIETPEGEVLKLETRDLLGETEMRSYGEVRDGTMVLVLEAGGQRKQAAIPWEAGVRGPYGPELSLSRQPIQAGDSRSVKTFIPLLNKIGVTHMEARAPETVELGGNSKRSLLRIDSRITELDGTPMTGMDTTYWIDDTGQILKSFTDVFGGQYTYRTTESAARAPGLAKLDLLKKSILKVASKIPDSSSTRQILYRVRMKADDPAEIFPNDRRQTLRRTNDPKSAILEVRTAGPTDGAAGPKPDGDEFLKPNTQINSTDPRVVDLMKQAVGDKSDPWAKAVAITGWVARNMTDKNFETAFAPAKEVAQTLSGDCTEHSVLTAAMCRAAGIPARVAIGVVYAENLGGFGFHMWNEVYVNGRWVALDAAFDESEVDATHIKLSDSSLDGVSPFDAFMSVVRVFDKLDPRAGRDPLTRGRACLPGARGGRRLR